MVQRRYFDVKVHQYVFAKVSTGKKKLKMNGFEALTHLAVRFSIPVQGEKQKGIINVLGEC